ncbi:hypothetical protein ZWY2020_032439 [Hordeum vulgare]|nr:hypothetical protein ZWY2020_032439 [Hordeum vulgare]
MVIATGAGNLEQVSDALHSEALTILHAINTTIQTMQMKTAVTHGDYDLYALGAIFKDIKFQLRVGFNDVTVISCPRTCNLVVQCLAAYGAKLGARRCEIWLGQYPYLINDVVVGDLSNPDT